VIAVILADLVTLEDVVAVETVEDAVDLVTLEDGVAVETVVDVEIFLTHFANDPVLFLARNDIKNAGEDGVVLETVEDAVVVEAVAVGVAVDHGSMNAAIAITVAAMTNLNTAAILMQVYVQAMIQHVAETMITAVTTTVSTPFANALIPLLAHIKNAGEDGVVLETVEDAVVVEAVAVGVAVDAAIAITVAAMTNLNTAAISMQVYVQAMIQHVAETMITAVTTAVSTLFANVPMAILVLTQKIKKLQNKRYDKYSFLTFKYRH